MGVGRRAQPIVGVAFSSRSNNGNTKDIHLLLPWRKYAAYSGAYAWGGRPRGVLSLMAGWLHDSPQFTVL